MDACTTFLETLFHSVSPDCSQCRAELLNWDMAAILRPLLHEKDAGHTAWLLLLAGCCARNRWSMELMRLFDYMDWFLLQEASGRFAGYLVEWDNPQLHEYWKPVLTTIDSLQVEVDEKG